MESELQQYIEHISASKSSETYLTQVEDGFADIYRCLEMFLQSNPTPDFRKHILELKTAMRLLPPLMGLTGIRKGRVGTGTLKEDPECWTQSSNHQDPPVSRVKARVSSCISIIRVLLAMQSESIQMYISLKDLPNAITFWKVFGNEAKLISCRNTR
jgi:hypothetical protein